MRSIPKAALAFLLAATASCAAYASGGDPYPPGTPPGYGAYPQARYDDRHSPDWEVGFFYQELSPYGDWIFTYEYGWTWLPRNVRFGWRPYYYGRWVPSEFGWYWVSSEPFGWATYHYGRWALHPRFGWIWLPGRTWGPAWVAWQYGHGWLGWAPLPPEVGFEIGIGLRFDGFNLSVGLGPQWYVFVEERSFLDRDVYRHAAPTARNVTIIQNTTNITHYTFVDNRVINRGVELQQLERTLGRRVPQYRVSASQTERSELVRGDEVRIYKPPKARLDSVRVDESLPGRGRGAERRSQAERPQPEGRVDRPAAAQPPEGAVAPRVKPERPSSDAQLQRQEQKEKEKLQAYERSERQRLEKLQREERAKQKAPPAKSEEVSKRQSAERQALEQEMKRAQQQLESRQEVERRAAKAKEAKAKASGGSKSEPARGKSQKDAGQDKKKESKGKPPRAR